MKIVNKAIWMVVAGLWFTVHPLIGTHNTANNPFACARLPYSKEQFIDRLQHMNTAPSSQEKKSIAQTVSRPPHLEGDVRYVSSKVLESLLGVKLEATALQSTG